MRYKPSIKQGYSFLPINILRVAWQGQTFLFFDKYRIDNQDTRVVSKEAYCGGG